MSAGGRVEFAMPKARVTVQPERTSPEVHVFWACAAFAALLCGIPLGQYIEQHTTPKPSCRAALPDGRRLLTEHLGDNGGPVSCLYTPPPPPNTKRKWT